MRSKEVTKFSQRLNSELEQVDGQHPGQRRMHALRAVEAAVNLSVALAEDEYFEDEAVDLLQEGLFSLRGFDPANYEYQEAMTLEDFELEEELLETAEGEA